MPSYAETDPLADIKESIRDEFPQVVQIDTASYLKEYRRSSEEANTLILDVREAKEFDVSHIDGAVLATELEMALEALENLPKDTPIVAYCAVGYRSSKLAALLQKQGFSNVRNLEGSIFEWARKGYPLKNSYKETDKVHPYDWWWKRLVEPDLRAWKPEK